LLVEDNADLRDVTAALLRKQDYDVESVDTVAAAREKASERVFDVLIADVCLPDGSGLELLRVLRKRNAKLKGIAVSGLGSDSDVDDATHAGFALHLKKPFGLPDLNAALRRVL
jgi:DNA-binding response OmpR family regulator